MPKSKLSAFAILKSAFYRTWDLLLFLSANGSWRLMPLEKLVIEAVLQALSAPLASVVRAQLKQRFFIERSSSARINVIRFYEQDPAKRIADERFLDRMYSVRLSTADSEDTAHVRFYKGYIFAVEFQKSPTYYGNNACVRSVTVDSPRKGFTREIDRAEHG